MGVLPVIPDSVRTREQLEDWIDGAVTDDLVTNLAARLRFLVAVGDRGREIRNGTPAVAPAGVPQPPAISAPETVHDR